MHLLSKYVRARDERGLSVEDSIRYALEHVGTAILVNTLVLSAGFLVMMTSAFKLNVDLGLMTVLAIVWVSCAMLLVVTAENGNSAMEDWRSSSR